MFALFEDQWRNFWGLFGICFEKWSETVWRLLKDWLRTVCGLLQRTLWRLKNGWFPVFINQPSYEKTKIDNSKAWTFICFIFFKEHLALDFWQQGYHLGVFFRPVGVRILHYKISSFILIVWIFWVRLLWEFYIDWPIGQWAVGYL